MNSRCILKDYRRLARIAGHPLVTLKLLTVDGMPQNQQFNNPIEDTQVPVISARQEVEWIIRAMKSVQQKSFEVLYYTYLDKNEHTDTEISELIMNSFSANKTIERRRKEALLEFCESCRNGKLLVFKMRDS